MAARVCVDVGAGGALSVAGGRAGAKLLVRRSHAAFGASTSMREADIQRKKENSVSCLSFGFFLGPVLLRSVLEPSQSCHSQSLRSPGTNA